MIPSLRWLLLIPTLAFVLTFGWVLAGYLSQTMNRQESPRLGRSMIALVVRESLLRMMSWVVRPLGGGDTEPSPWTDAPAPDRSRHPPVLLLPGVDLNRTAMWPLCQFLSHRGWRWLWPVNHSKRPASLGQQAERLAQQVARLQAVTGAKKIDLVGFSTGGVVAAWYLRRLDGAAQVRRLVTIGTPWKGARSPALLPQRGADRRPDGSEDLEELAPPPVPCVAIWSPDDPLVIPASSAVPAGASEVCVEGAGHLDMLLSSRVFRAVQAALSHPLPQSDP